MTSRDAPCPEKSAPLVSVLTVGFNSKAYLPDCFSAVAEAAGATSYEILFVNNGCDDSEEYLASHMPEVRVLPGLGNVGFAKANNYLAEHAAGRFLILLNPDTTLYPHAIDWLVEAALAQPEFRILGGVTVDADGKMQIKSIASLPTFTGYLRGLLGLGGREIAFRAGEHVLEVDAVDGGFMLIEREHFLALGGLDESFFLYGEDQDLCRRVSHAGGRIGRLPQCKVYHDVGSGSALSPLRSLYSATGSAHYIHKHNPPWRAWPTIALLWANHMRRFLVGRLLAPFKPRYAELAKGYRGTALAPLRWMRGYDASGADPRKPG